MEHKRLLEGGCFVIDRGGLDQTSSGDWHQAVVVDRDSGASAMSQFRVCLDGIDTPVRRFPDADCVLFVLKGRGTVVIGGRRFDLSPECGAFIGPGEAFRIVPVDGALELLLTVCPQSEEGEWLEQMAEDFDDSYPQRVALVDEKKREATGDRFYQVLVDAELGSTQITQFIGVIPQSKSPQHFHTYEEVITVLSGNGLMWAGTESTPIRAGSMIFLPRKQAHCLECQDEEGMHLIGHFYPAGSPAVRY
ncbi:MAG: cupin domain-containing protein [Gammaproteobacteria bacterium]|nr:cupin domain-containing protein [Gammaproteobacteria bacterium]MCZ6826222.1 cupin domain-containing protein [Gammaproteobacteria bacterium]